LLPIMGIPWEVPVPKNVILRADCITTKITVFFLFTYGIYYLCY
jgi:hypothetical protein